ncbi:hypothetical protein SynPROSU1_02160 [Synechococcus sp. PROS-U-1]|nr:hypothetical protein SynPROSU1_02160 [Synechococcus sp. PROS-U-1]
MDIGGARFHTLKPAQSLLRRTKQQKSSEAFVKQPLGTFLRCPY